MSNSVKDLDFADLELKMIAMLNDPKAFKEAMDKLEATDPRLLPLLPRLDDELIEVMYD